MKILLLGGYRFLGRAIIEAAQSRGHSVTAFNRGNLTTLPDVQEIHGDRDDPRALAGRSWDAVIDTSGYIPRHVRATTEVLRDSVDTYVFISTLAVYAVPMADGSNESAARKPFPTGANPDGSDLTAETYGARKVLCEDELESALPGRNLAVRAGFIVGPYDSTDRFSSWIERAARSEPFLVPGEPNAPLQMIDVRDLATWIVGAAEAHLQGPYNVTAPAQPYTVLDVARACLNGTASRASAVLVPTNAAKAAGLLPGRHIPFWMEPESYSLMRANIDRALATGLRIRPLVDTVRDTWAWLRTSDHPRQIVCPPELERAAIAAARESSA